METKKKNILWEFKQNILPEVTQNPIFITGTWVQS